MGALQDKTVVVVGRGSGIARAVALLARSEGARVIVAGRDEAALAEAYHDDPNIHADTVDITDDTSIAALADRVGSVDHVVSTASARARGKLADLQREDLQRSFDTKIIGPVMLAKHFALQINPGGHSCCSRACTPSKSRSATSGWPSPTGCRLPHPLIGCRAQPDQGQHHFSWSHRHRRLGRDGRRG